MLQPPAGRQLLALLGVALVALGWRLVVPCACAFDRVALIPFRWRLVVVALLGRGCAVVLHCTLLSVLAGRRFDRSGSSDVDTEAEVLLTGIDVSEARLGGRRQPKREKNAISARWPWRAVQTAAHHWAVGGPEAWHDRIGS